MILILVPIVAYVAVVLLLVSYAKDKNTLLLSILLLLLSTYISQYIYDLDLPNIIPLLRAGAMIFVVPIVIAKLLKD